jgi:hypothetical protein
MTKLPTHTYANVTIPNGGNITSTNSNSVLTSNGLSATWAISNNINNGKVKISDTDIEIDGLSLKATLQAVNSRLAILIPNPALEREFEELRACGNEYRRLEQEFQEQIRVWNVLKKTD